jgi:hypothetical protein
MIFKIKLKLGLLIAVVMLSLTAAAQKSTRNFVWGINGHPLTQQAYSNNLTDQIQSLNDLKVNSYRFDVLLDPQGYAKKEGQFIELLSRLKNNNIATLLVLMQSGLKGLDPEETYQTSYNQGKNFANKYGESISVVEISNEADNKILLPGNLTGLKAADYDMVKAQKVIAGIKGFIDGLKSVNPSIKVSISVSYLHFYYLQLLQDNDVNYDIIGCHWYSNMGDITNARAPVGNVLLRVSQQFKKPIWITEFNYGKGSLRVTYQKQKEYLYNTILQIMSQGIITGFFIYELYDQPELRQRYPLETSYGLIQKDSIGHMTEKDAYMGYKQAIQKISQSRK